MIQTTLQQAFSENNGVLTTKMAKQQYQIDDSTLRRAAARGDIERYTRGIYYLDIVDYDDLYFMQLKYPKAVYCYESAVMLHTLSTYSPFTFNLGFAQGYHLQEVLAKKQHVTPHYYPKKELSAEYIETMPSWDGNPIRVTNLEKTVIDMLRSDDVMLDIVDEMIHDYCKREHKNIERLKDYSERFGVTKIVEERILPFVKSTKIEVFGWK